MRRTIRHLVTAAGYASYDAYGDGAHWRRVRRSWRTRSDLPQWCVVCGSPRFVLHHRWYERDDGTSVLGAERASDLVPLCASHHSRLHRERNAQRPIPPLAWWTDVFVARERAAAERRPLAATRRLLGAARRRRR